MNPCLAAVVSSIAIALAGVGFASTAGRRPVDRSGPTVLRLHALRASGGSSVGRHDGHATLTPYPCTGSINPNSMTVCITPEQSPSAGKCGFSAVPDYAEVFVPYKPGTTYVTRGTGCGSVCTTQGSICSTQGPYITTP